jgi:hypothetical protein
MLAIRPTSWNGPLSWGAAADAPDGTLVAVVPRTSSLTARRACSAVGETFGRTAIALRNEKEGFHEAHYRNHQAIQAG